MKFDFTQLEQNLQKYKVEQFSKQDIGMSRAMQYVWNHTPTKVVDFNTFKLDDALRAFYDFHFLPHSDDEITAADLIELRDHPWEVNARLDNVIMALTKINYKVYESEDDFI